MFPLDIVHGLDYSKASYEKMKPRFCGDLHEKIKNNIEKGLY
ncbi:hypothetical protein HMPREF1584_00261 [Gardnerella vaginalis JCP8481A]|uniref:Uncharacterized protein n=1 Tax=Gardnerella vaginalis TaxID=2702 RepID=A0A133NSQ6_GARVA|nr:hypothetical protein HMPREF1585_00548 [Gardnerella vaginalis JCP8481B]EPI44330.1 hypothetical protein HMPREF1584_00261 [Gardnerella vaginalis JCP8481A]KXA19324.1 hypothetical protein HMPREF3208_01085 [Gardnerella vaginalis]